MNRLELLNKINLPYAVEIIKEFHSLSAMSKYEFNWDYMYRNGEFILSQPTYFCMLAVDETETYCGIVSAYTTPFFFSPQLQAVETCWYVREGTKERTKIAVKLMKSLIDWAFNEKAVVMLQSGDVACIEPLAVDEMYRRLGFKRYGTIFQLEK